MQERSSHDQQLNDQINQKLTQLWSGIKNKRKQLVKNYTPGYSRRNDNSDTNLSNNQSMHFSTHQHQSENALLQVRQKLAQEVTEHKKKQLQIEKLQRTIAELTRDKHILLMELQNAENQSPNLNESSIRSSKDKTHIIAQTANFSTSKKRNPKERMIKTIQQEDLEYNEANKTIPANNNKNGEVSQGHLQDLSKNRLIQLLRSTNQYRRFVYYYDSHQLSYLHRLNEQHNRNCEHNISQKEKRNWAPTEILEELHTLNYQAQLGLSQRQVQLIVSKMKFYYQSNFQERLKKAQNDLQRKFRKQLRQQQNSVPYDLLQVKNARERQLSKKRTLSALNKNKR